MKVGYIGGFWSTNVGNAFYNLGALWLLKKVYGQQNVAFVPDPPQVQWINLKNDYALIPALELDLIVISGPIFGSILKKVYTGIFDKIHEKGKCIAFISAGACEYTDKEAERVAQFLKKYRISFVFTRDSATYNLYKNKLDTVVYNGLCTSVFLPDAFTPLRVNDDYIVFNFDRWHEPIIVKTDNEWAVKKRILGGSQETMLGYNIIRTQSYALAKWPIYLSGVSQICQKNNVYYSDAPYGYLSILKHAKYIFSDRVHTCAAGLIYGTKCMYVSGSRRSRDGRSNLFSRLDIPGICNEPVLLDLEYIGLQKEDMERALVSTLPDHP